MLPLARPALRRTSRDLCRYGIYWLPAVHAKYKNGLPLLGLCDHAFLPFRRKLRAYLVRVGERCKDKLSEDGVHLNSSGLPSCVNRRDRDGE